MSSRLAMVLLACLAAPGCGLVFQGFHQDVEVRTNLIDAVVALGDETMRAPATFRVRRRDRWRVARLDTPGFAPACQVVRCPYRKSLKILDMIPLFIPFAFDAALGTLPHCFEPVFLQTREMPPDVKPYALPSADEILHTLGRTRHLVDICAAPHLFDAEFGKQAKHIIVTAGPLEKDYETLGNLDIVAPGLDRIRGNTVQVGNFAQSRFLREFRQANAGEVNEIIRREALLRFGKAVDAVINVNYMINPRNDVSASGVAIRFTDAAPSSTRR